MVGQDGLIAASAALYSATALSARITKPLCDYCVYPIMADFIRNWLLDPMALLFLVSLATILLLMTRRRRASYRGASRPVFVVGVWLAVFLLFAAPIIVNPLLMALEEQYPESLVCEAGSHLVMLGGGIDSRVESVREFGHMSQATISRATAAARIAEREPALRMVAAGGAVKHIAEADLIASYWITLGVEEHRIVREVQSSNTRENAINVALLLNAETIEGPVRLVTSALHMPRAVMTFRKVLSEQGVELCAVSVDREAKTDTPWWAVMPQTTTLWKFDKLFHEIVALAVYRLRGWI